ncbi:hypothetical protein JYT71_00355 [Acidimicrobiaceae bacterium AH-315-P05]|nr:hypothetical protein [Acidimicrobiaceae bacterium AH-315-P05]
MFSAMFFGPLIVALLAPIATRLASRVGQPALLIPGGFAFAGSGLWRVVALDADGKYWVGYFPAMALSGIGVALLLPQPASVTAQALPANRLGVGAATDQALRHLGGTFGVALTIAFVGTANRNSETFSSFNNIWLLLIASRLLTSALAMPLRHPSPAPNVESILAPINAAC